MPCLAQFNYASGLRNDCTNGLQAVLKCTITVAPLRGRARYRPFQITRAVLLMRKEDILAIKLFVPRTRCGCIQFVPVHTV